MLPGESTCYYLHMALFGRRKRSGAGVPGDEIFSVAYTAYYAPGTFGGESTWISDSASRGFIEKSKATTAQIRKARLELINWMLSKTSVPSSLAQASRDVLADQLLEEEFVTWLSDVTCNGRLDPPLFDTEGLRAKMQKVPEIPTGWDSFERHVWRLRESQAHGSRLRQSIIRVTTGPQKAALVEMDAISSELERQSSLARASGGIDKIENDSASYCGLPACPHCSPP
jgi:hypothetical protein